MKHISKIKNGVLRLLSPVAVSVFAFGLLVAAPQAQALTSGNAIIYNSVKVDYTSGGSAYVGTANVSVTVDTLGVAPTVAMTPATATVPTNDPYTLTVEVISNSNGVADYYSANASVDNLVGAPTGLTANGTINLWGGYVLSSIPGEISIPNGSEVGLVAGNTIRIGADRFTVGLIIPGGTLASTDVAGVVTPETNTTVQLFNLGTAVPSIIAPAVGAQIGEVGTYTVSITNAGTPTTIGVDGSHVITTSVTTSATDIGGNAIIATTASSTLTITSAALTISKVSDVANAKPGATITYTITVNNPSATASATVTSITDAVPVYTTYVANSTTLNGTTVAGDGLVSPLAAGLVIDSDVARVAAALATGTIPPLGSAVIVYQVTVD